MVDVTEVFAQIYMVKWMQRWLPLCVCSCANLDVGSSGIL